MRRHEISNSDHVIYSRDVIKRIEELENEYSEIKEAHEEAQADESVTKTYDGITPDEWQEGDEGQELKALLALADEADSSSDWRHGETLINDDYFESYAQELAEDCGMVQSGAAWPNDCIDWELAAERLKDDYTSVDFDGQTFWIRS